MERNEAGGREEVSTKTEHNLSVGAAARCVARVLLHAMSRDRCAQRSKEMGLSKLVSHPVFLDRKHGGH